LRRKAHGWAFNRPSSIVVLSAWLLACLASSNAQAADKSKLIVNLVAVAVKSEPNFSGSAGSSLTYPSYSPEWSFGGGVLLGIPVFNSVPGPIDSFYQIFRSLNLDVELGALYFKRCYPLSAGSSSATATTTVTGTASVPEIGTSQTVLQFPLIFRFGAPFGVSLGAGVYYGLNRTQTSGMQFKDKEFGGVASGQIFLGQRFGYGFLVDARYTFSLTDVTTVPGTKTTFTDLQILMGIRI
jgi:hypothetical protein